jgi:hypothetical protein
MAAAAADQLNSPFRRAMLYVIQQLGEVGVEKLEKILYLADLEYFHRTGRKITGARWVRHRFGPMAKAVIPSRNMMNGREITVSEEEVGGHSSFVYRVGPAPRFAAEVAPDQMATLDRIIRMLASVTAAEAAQLTYETLPMQERLKAEAEAGREILDVPLVFDDSRERVTRLAHRSPTATAEARTAFKRSELARVRDIQGVAISRSA